MSRRDVLRATGMRRRAQTAAGPMLSEGPARIIVVKGEARGRKFVIEDELTLGRGRTANVFLDEDDISREHARIYVERGHRIEDLGSRNGTFVNDFPLEGSRLLQFGDRIRLGAHTVILFTHYDSGEADVLKRQRLELLGRMAAGIAHDLNNLLGALLATQDYLLETPQTTTLGDPETRECMKEIKSAGQQAAHLMPKLLSFARGHSDGHRVFNLSIMCDEMMTIVRRTFDRRIRMVTNVAPDLHVVGDRVEIQQVIMNLCINARDAMGDGGELILNLSAVPDKPGRRPKVQIQVIDTGEGMESAICRRIFEPFFTTKGEGRGSGLGLANVKEMIVLHGGKITVSSVVGKGTVFTITLPMAADERLECNTIAPTCNHIVLSAQILLVDDDELCRNAFARVLNRAGHRVTVAKDGSDALRHVKRMGSSLDLVLLDVDMPELSGEETLRMIRHIEPEVCVIAVTGNRDRGRQQAMLDGGALALVAKPFTQHTLITAVNTALMAAEADEETKVHKVAPVGRI